MRDPRAGSQQFKAAVGEGQYLTAAVTSVPLTTYRPQLLKVIGQSDHQAGRHSHRTGDLLLRGRGATGQQSEQPGVLGPEPVDGDPFGEPVGGDGAERAEPEGHGVGELFLLDILHTPHRIID